MTEAAGLVADDDGLEVEQWLRESRELAVAVVYTNEILAPVRAVSEGKADRLPRLTPSEDYLKAAGGVARGGFVRLGTFSRLLGRSASTLTMATSPLGQQNQSRHRSRSGLPTLARSITAKTVVSATSPASRST